LIELLISALIAGLIVSGLLGIVVELVSTNRRELARSETMRDMGIATEFISNELREALYVYTGNCLWEGENKAGEYNYCPGLFGKGYLKAPPKSLPLVAFWKLDPVPENCSDPKLCTKYQLSGRTYTLVVYFLSRENKENIWEGRARITRAELAQFKADGTENKQYVHPRENNITLQTWPETFDGVSGLSGQSIAFESPTTPVLVDYVDDTKDIAGRDSVQCPLGYKKTPSDQSLKDAEGDFEGVRSVYGCVRDELFKSTAELTVTNQTLNQKVILTIRGNPEGRYGLDRRGCSQESLSEKEKSLSTELGKDTQQSTCRLAAVKTEVLNRGTINKEPTTLPELQK